MITSWLLILQFQGQLPTSWNLLPFHLLFSYLIMFIPSFILQSFYNYYYKYICDSKYGIHIVKVILNIPYLVYIRYYLF
jgi:hypothetical protein